MKETLSAGLARIAALALIGLACAALWGLATLMPSRDERDRRAAEAVCPAGRGIEDPACAEAVAAAHMKKDGAFVRDVVVISIL